MTVGAIMLPLTKSNEQFQSQNSVMYSDWEVFKSNGDKGLPAKSYDVFWVEVNWMILQHLLQGFIYDRLCKQ